MSELCDLGVLGLAVMGANLARNAARKGFGVALYKPALPSAPRNYTRSSGTKGRFTPAKTLKDFVAALSKPRVMIIMVKAGKPVDAVIDELVPLLDAGRHRHRRRQLPVLGQRPPLRMP